MTRRPANPELVNLLRSLRKKSSESKVAFWREIANRLGKSRRRRIAVNLSRINRYTDVGETVVVPGKVLGAGKLTHPVNIAAFQFSKQAQQKITQVKGRCMTLAELMEENPKGSNVKILG